MPRDFGGPSPDEMEMSKQQAEIVPNYRKPVTPIENPNFAGSNYEKRAESILATLEQMDKLIATADDTLESAHRNLLLEILKGMKSALHDEYLRLAKPEWYSESDGVGTTKLHPATLASLEKALTSWGLEIRGTRDNQ
jgi:hypothetical protein